MNEDFFSSSFLEITCFFQNNNFLYFKFISNSFKKTFKQKQIPIIFYINIRLMEIMLKVQASNPDADDPQIGFFFQAWGRISSVLAQDFVPYLPYVMPANLAAAKLGPTVKVSDGIGER